MADVYSSLQKYGIAIQHRGKGPEEAAISAFFNNLDAAGLSDEAKKAIVSNTFGDAVKYSGRGQVGYMELSNALKDKKLNDLNSIKRMGEQYTANQAQLGRPPTASDFDTFMDTQRQIGEMKREGEALGVAGKEADKLMEGMQFGVEPSDSENAALSNLRDRYGSVDLRRSEALVGQQGAEATAQRGLMGSLAAAGVQGGAAGAALTDMAQSNIRARRGIESTVRQEKDALSKDIYNVELERKAYRDKELMRRNKKRGTLTGVIAGAGDQEPTTSTPVPRPKGGK